MLTRFIGVCAIACCPVMSHAATLDLTFDIGAVTSSDRYVIRPLSFGGETIGTTPGTATISGSVTVSIDTDILLGSTVDNAGSSYEVRLQSGSSDLTMGEPASVTSLRQPRLNTSGTRDRSSDGSIVNWRTEYRASSGLYQNAVSFRVTSSDTVRQSSEFWDRLELGETLQVSIADVVRWDRNDPAPLAPEDAAEHTLDGLLSLLGDAYDDPSISTLFFSSQRSDRDEFREYRSASGTRIQANLSLVSATLDGQALDLAALNEVSAVPLPAGAVGLLTGMGVFAWVKRRRKACANA